MKATLKTPLQINECIWCNVPHDLDYMVYHKESNSNPGYLVIKDKAHFDKDIVNKFTYILNLNDCFGIVPMCSECVMKLLAQIFSTK